MAQLVKKPSAMWETWVWSLGCIDPLKKGKATHSSILAGIIPRTVWSMWSQRVRRNWATFTHSLHSLIIIIMSLISIVIDSPSLFFRASDFIFTTRHIYSWVSFLFGPEFSFFLESFLCSSQVACWTSTNLGGLTFQCHIFLPFHTVHGVLEARILRWFAIALSLNRLVHSFIEMHKVMLKIL